MPVDASGREEDVAKLNPSDAWLPSMRESVRLSIWVLSQK